MAKKKKRPDTKSEVAENHESVDASSVAVPRGEHAGISAIFERLTAMEIQFSRTTRDVHRMEARAKEVENQLALTERDFTVRLETVMQGLGLDPNRYRIDMNTMTFVPR